MKLWIKPALICLVVLQTITLQAHTNKECKREKHHTHSPKKEHKSMHEERFPADYFLIHKNMPHYMRIFSKYENDPLLGLSDAQKEKLQKLREKVVIEVSRLALKIKELEQKLQKEVVFKSTPKRQLESSVEEIAKLRSELTLSHIECIQKTKALLTSKQHAFFLDKLGIKR